jgi:hypothetical protein
VGLQRRGALCITSLIFLVMSVIPFYDGSTIILSVIFFWIGFFIFVSVTHVFDFNTSLPEYFDRLRYGPKTSTLFYTMIDTFPAFVWCMLLFNSYLRSIVFHQVDFQQVFYLGIYSACIIAIIAIFAICLLEGVRVSDPLESLVSTLITLTIANFASIPSPSFLDISKDPTELKLFSILNLLMWCFNFLLLKVFPLIALGLLFIKSFLKSYKGNSKKHCARTQTAESKSLRKRAQNIFLSFVKKKTIEIGLLLLAMAIISLNFPVGVSDMLDPFWIISIVIIAITSCFLILERNNVVKVASNPYMLDYASLSCDRVKIQRKRVLIQLVWLAIGLVGIIVPFLLVLYYYS